MTKWLADRPGRNLAIQRGRVSGHWVARRLVRVGDLDDVQRLVKVRRVLPPLPGVQGEDGADRRISDCRQLPWLGTVVTGVLIAVLAGLMVNYLSGPRLTGHLPRRAATASSRP